MASSSAITFYNSRIVSKKNNIRSVAPVGYYPINKTGRPVKMAMSTSFPVSGWIRQHQYPTLAKIEGRNSDKVTGQSLLDPVVNSVSFLVIVRHFRRFFCQAENEREEELRLKPKYLSNVVLSFRIVTRCCCLSFRWRWPFHCPLAFAAAG